MHTTLKFPTRLLSNMSPLLTRSLFSSTQQPGPMQQLNLLLPQMKNEEHLHRFEYLLKQCPNPLYSVSLHNLNCDKDPTVTKIVMQALHIYREQTDSICLNDHCNKLGDNLLHRAVRANNYVLAQDLFYPRQRGSVAYGRAMYGSIININSRNKAGENIAHIELKKEIIDAEFLCILINNNIVLSRDDLKKATALVQEYGLSSNSDSQRQGYTI